MIMTTGLCDVSKLDFDTCTCTRGRETSTRNDVECARHVVRCLCVHVCREAITHNASSYIIISSLHLAHDMRIVPKAMTTCVVLHATCAALTPSIPVITHLLCRDTFHPIYILMIMMAGATFSLHFCPVIFVCHILSSSLS